MPEEKKECYDKCIEFPEINTYQFDKERCHIYLGMYDNIFETDYTIIFDAYQFIDWIGEKELKEIKKSLIKHITEK
jgi:hypothetical protein